MSVAEFLYFKAMFLNDAVPYKRLHYFSDV